MSLLSISNQNGAPSDTASAVTIQPRSFTSQAVKSGGNVPSQPIGRPCFLIRHRFRSTLHSGEFGSLHASVSFQQLSGLGDGVGVRAAAGVGPGVAVWFALAYSCAAETNESRIDLSVDRCLTITTESMLAPPAIKTPRTRMITGVRRLYQPDTRSIELLNQFSMFSLALATSLPAASIRVSKALFTCSGRI